MENFKFSWVSGKVPANPEQEYLVRLKLHKGGSEVYDVAKYVSGVWAFPYNRRAFPDKWEWHGDNVGEVVAYAELPPAPTFEELQASANAMEVAARDWLDSIDEADETEADDIEADDE